MAKHTVKQGECISSIAYEHGFFPDTLWNLPENTELKEKRKDPNVLFPGDEVFIPDKRGKEEDGATEECHRFRKRGVPAKLRLRFLKQAEEEPSEREIPPEDTKSLHATISEPEPVPPPGEEPRANVPYVFEIDGDLVEGKTDDDGMVELSIPPNARQAKIIFEQGTDRETVYPLKLGCLNPRTETSGAKERLHNLGYICEDDSEETTGQFEEALRNFQARHDLPVTGELDQVTMDKLKEVHGS